MSFATEKQDFTTLAEKVNIYPLIASYVTMNQALENTAAVLWLCFWVMFIEQVLYLIGLDA